MNRLIALNMIIISILFLQGGCAAYRTYPGEKLPKSEVALLNVPWTNIVVDGSPIPDKFVSNLELLPGSHVIEWEFVHTNDFREQNQLEFVAQANHRYQLGQRFFSANGLDGVVGFVADLALDTALLPLKLLIDEDEPTEPPDGEYYIWIIERGTQRIVAGMAPDIVQAHQEITFVPIEAPLNSKSK